MFVMNWPFDRHGARCHIDVRLHIERADCRVLEARAVLKLSAMAVQQALLEQAIPEAPRAVNDLVVDVDTAHPSRKDPMLRLVFFHLRRQYEVLQAQRGRLSAAGSAESVHEMRIATRKTRAALRVFRDLLPEPGRSELHQELRWLAGELGKTRDLDMYIANIEQCVDELEERDRAALRAQLRYLAAARAQAHRHLRDALTSDRCHVLIRRFAGFLDGQPSASALRRWGSFRICDGADLYLDKTLRRILKRGRHISKSSPAAALHALRISSKRYRYLLEFFLPLYERKLGKAFKATRRIQNFLGDHQDSCVAEERLRKHAAAVVGADELIALGQLVHLQTCRAAQIRKRFRKQWRRFKAAQPSFAAKS